MWFELRMSLRLEFTSDLIPNDKERKRVRQRDQKF